MAKYGRVTGRTYQGDGFYEDKEKPRVRCACCRSLFSARREWQRFCSTPCQQAWNHKKRQQILHANGQKKMETPRKPNTAGRWVKRGGRDIYIPAGYDPNSSNRSAEDLGL